MVAGEAFVFGAARKHLLPQVSRFKRSGLIALDVPLESGFERCRGEMAHRSMPLPFPEATGNLVRRQFGVRRRDIETVMAAVTMDLTWFPFSERPRQLSSRQHRRASEGEITGERQTLDLM